MINQPGLEGNILNLIKGIYTENPIAQDFLVGPGVKNLPAKCRGHRFDSWSRKLLHALGQLSPRATVTEPTHPTARDPQREAATQKSEHHSQRRARASTETRTTINKYAKALQLPSYSEVKGWMLFPEDGEGEKMAPLLAPLPFSTGGCGQANRPEKETKTWRD